MNPPRGCLREGGVNQRFTRIFLPSSARTSFRKYEEHLVHVRDREKKRSWKVYRRGTVRPSQMSRTSMFPPILRQFHSGNCILNASRIPSTLVFLLLALSLSHPLAISTTQYPLGYRDEIRPAHKREPPARKYYRFPIVR